MNLPLTWRLLPKDEALPYDLLLLADETVAAINKYIFDCDVYMVTKGEEQVAVFCLQKINADTIEIKNIAVKENYRGEGIGSWILNLVKEICREPYTHILVGTGDAGYGQIRFYEKNGFERCGIRKNFFLDNYTDPIIENGVQLKDMILLQFSFSKQSGS